MIKNYFKQILNSLIMITNGTAVVKLKNGDVLFIGGNKGRNGRKIQIYRY